MFQTSILTVCAWLQIPADWSYYPSSHSSSCPCRWQFSALAGAKCHLWIVPLHSFWTICLNSVYDKKSISKQSNHVSTLNFWCCYHHVHSCHLQILSFSDTWFLSFSRCLWCLCLKSRGPCSSWETSSAATLACSTTSSFSLVLALRTHLTATSASTLPR